jgi:hypothetical protein
VHVYDVYGERRGAQGCGARLSFAQQYFPGSAEILSCLRSALVLAGLQPNNALTSPQLLLGPLASVLLRRSRSQRRAPPLRVLVRLKPKIHSFTNVFHRGPVSRCDTVTVPFCRWQIWSWSLGKRSSARTGRRTGTGPRPALRT